jgi:hypothetical protein
MGEEDEFKALGIVASVSNVLSLIGSIYMIINIFLLYFKEKKKKRRISPHHHNLFFFALNSLILSFGGIIFNNLDHKSSRVVCVLQSLFITYFNLTNWFWSMAICFNL